MLKAFIDDSGSGGDSIWYVLAGYLGTVEGWDSFDEQWLRVLHEDPHIEYFKSSQAERLSRNEQWAGATKEQRDAKIDALIGVIARCASRAVCVRMRQADYDEIVKGNVPPAWDSPYYFLFTIFIGVAIQIETLDGESDDIEFVFDNDESHEKGFELMLPALARMHSTEGRIVNITRHDEKKVLPLQAADLVAWQIRRFFSYTNEPRRGHFDLAQYSLPKEPHTFVLDRAKTRDVMNDIRETSAKVAASLGRSPDVRTWS